MAIHLNPFRLYSSRLCLNQGILVSLLRATNQLWQNYQKLMELSGKRQMDIKALTRFMKKNDAKDLQTLLKKMKLAPKRRTKKTLKNIAKNIDDDFTKSFNDLNKVFNNINTILRDDETFLYRAMKEVRGLFKTVDKKWPKKKDPALPSHMIQTTQRSLYGLMSHMRDVQHHTWVASKAHARDRIKINELTIVSSRRESWRIRRQTIELDHIRNRIAPLKKKIKNINRVNNHDKIHELHDDIHEMLHLYHEEVEDLKEILHEAHVMTRRSEKLFHAVAFEAKHLGLKDIEKNCHSHHKKFKRMLTKIVHQARNQYRSMDRMMNGLTVPKYHAEAHTHIAKEVDERIRAKGLHRKDTGTAHHTIAHHHAKHAHR